MTEITIARVAVLFQLTNYFPCSFEALLSHRALTLWSPKVLRDVPLRGALIQVSRNCLSSSILMKSAISYVEVVLVMVSPRLAIEARASKYVR